MNMLLLIYLIQSPVLSNPVLAACYPSLRDNWPLDEVLPSIHICVYFFLFLQNTSFCICLEVCSSYFKTKMEPSSQD